VLDIRPEILLERVVISPHLNQDEAESEFSVRQPGTELEDELFRSLGAAARFQEDEYDFKSKKREPRLAFTGRGSLTLAMSYSRAT
jgi:hypothetical protein